MAARPRLKFGNPGVFFGSGGGRYGFTLKNEA